MLVIEIDNFLKTINSINSETGSRKHFKEFIKLYDEFKTAIKNSAKTIFISYPDMLLSADDIKYIFGEKIVFQIQSELDLTSVNDKVDGVSENSVETQSKILQHNTKIMLQNAEVEIVNAKEICNQFAQLKYDVLTMDIDDKILAPAKKTIKSIEKLIIQKHKNAKK